MRKLLLGYDPRYIRFIAIQNDHESVLVKRRDGRSSQPKLVAGQELTLIGDL
jgi:hypothetical protein